MSNQEYVHESVMLAESLQALDIKSDGTYLDATFGRGGHSAAILEQLGPNGRLLAIDRDPQAEEAAKDMMSDPRFSFQRGRFAELENITSDLILVAKLDGILMDVGVSSPQLDDPARGFSFSQDGPLDMRMDTDTGMSAADWLSAADEGEIAAVIKEFGEERFSKRIARAIVELRAETPLTSTRQLAELVARAIPRHEPGKHPATRTFQAIRIYINRELDELRDALAQSVRVLAPRGRLVVISFHSLEDRISKRFMRDAVRGKELPLGLPVTDYDTGATLKLVGKAVRASAEEVQRNPRSRSATLRVAEKLVVA